MDETAEVVAIRRRFKVGGTVYVNILRILETTQLEEPAGFKWYAPEVGVQARSKGEPLKLIGSTFQDRTQ